ncbi:MAG TPA: hypothetical protein VG942_10525 [Hyphomonadaceae bacterium]|nr:hypothetical protein [Hyphomonadaceae bacterium]
MRRVVACVAAVGLLAGCDAPKGEGGQPSAGMPSNDPNTFRASSSVNLDRPYAGDWAEDVGACKDEKKVWTVEPKRMAIATLRRFCAWDEVYLNQGSDGAPVSWASNAKCLQGGNESHVFVFFHVKDSLQEMKVTFNDTTSFDLVRCVKKA